MGGQSLYFTAGAIEVGEGAIAIHGFGRARKPVEGGIQHLLFTFHFIEKPGDYELIRDQPGRARGNRSRVVDADGGRRREQHDYGGEPDEIYQRRPNGTLRGYFRQQRIEGNEIFHRAGFQDLTADVNFSDLQAWGDACDFKTVNYLTQREFVGNWYPRALTEPEQATVFTLDQSGAGTAFKVLHQRKG